MKQIAIMKAKINELSKQNEALITKMKKFDTKMDKFDIDIENIKRFIALAHPRPLYRPH